jgi:hypothetical protein
MILPAMARRGFRGKRVEAKRAGMMAIASKELPVYTTEQIQWKRDF